MKNTLICAKKAVNISTHNVITKSFYRLSAIFRLQNRCEKPKKGRAKKNSARSASRFKYVESLVCAKRSAQDQAGLRPHRKQQVYDAQIRQKA